MPVYEYRCRKCGKEYEIRASMSEYARGLKTVCPECGSEESERVISLAAILGGSPGGSSFGAGGCGGPSCCGGGN